MSSNFSTLRHRAPGPVVCAPDSFKGTLSAARAAAAMAAGVREAWAEAEVRLCPLADGGEGSLDVLRQAAGGVTHTVRVEGPLGNPVDAEFLELPGKEFVIEMARASGLMLVPGGNLRAEDASTYGTGQLIRAALDEDARSVVVCLGGSATTDGGAGMAQALGFGLLDVRGQPIGRGGGQLQLLARISPAGAHPWLDRVRFTAATDVVNPLCGPSGAAAVYGPQKGASPDAVERLDRGLAKLAEIIRRDLGPDASLVPGAGAAGGLGAGMIGFLRAEIASGAEVMMDAAGIDQALHRAFLCLTGEGRIDAQSAQGKLVGRLARRCQKAGTPLVAIGGQLAPDARVLLESSGFAALLSAVNRPGPAPTSAEEAESLLSQAAETVCRLVQLGRRLGP